MALNGATNRFRRLGRERRRRERSGVATQPEVADPMLERALRRLPVDQRAVVVLRFHLDWSVEQTAEALDIAPGTVKSRLHRALQTLRADLQEDA